MINFLNPHIVEYSENNKDWNYGFLIAEDLDEENYYIVSSDIFSVNSTEYNLLEDSGKFKYIKELKFTINIESKFTKNILELYLEPISETGTKIPLDYCLDEMGVVNDFYSEFMFFGLSEDTQLKFQSKIESLKNIKTKTDIYNGYIEVADSLNLKLKKDSINLYLSVFKK